MLRELCREQSNVCALCSQSARVQERAREQSNNLLCKQINPALQTVIDGILRAAEGFGVEPGGERVFGNDLHETRGLGGAGCVTRKKFQDLHLPRPCDGMLSVLTMLRFHTLILLVTKNTIPAERASVSDICSACSCLSPVVNQISLPS